MRLNAFAYFALAAARWAVADDTDDADDADDADHGEGDEGTIMGPVAFLWPENRNWTAAYDNIGPCGSKTGVINRTEFPLTGGYVSLSIADDAWRVAFYVSYDNDPTTQSDFTQQLVSNVTEIYPGHQCYKVDELSSAATNGSNGTIQLEYWAHYKEENGGHNESFYACADVTFVPAAEIAVPGPCFNVTATDFIAGSYVTSTSTASATAATSSGATTSATNSASSGHSGLSGGAKAGIAVGVVVGVLGIAGIAAFALRHRRLAKRNSRRVAQMEQMQMSDR